MKNIMFSKLSFSFILIFTVCFFTNICSCNSQVHNYCTNPDSLIAAQINTHKVIMMGESPHNNYVCYDGLVSIINYWINDCAKDKSNEYILNVVFESDSVHSSCIDHYVKTGNDSMLNLKVTPFFFFEDVECFNNLRHLKIKIDSLNINRYNKIVLNIMGFENYDERSSVNIYSKSRKDGELWFVNERDSVVSMKLINYINSHNKNNHFIMEYGDAHLERGLTNKKKSSLSIPEEECNGYYIPHFLVQEYGDSNVLSFMNGRYIDKLFHGTFIEQYVNQNVLIPSKEFPFNFTERENNLYWVIRPPHNPNSHLFPMVFSRFIIDRLSEKIELYEKFLPGFKANQIYTNYMESIFYSTGIKFRNSSELNAWLITKPEFDGLERFDSKEFADVVYHLYSDTSFQSNIRILNKLGFPESDSVIINCDSVHWIMNWTKFNKKAKFINCVGIYWVGYAEERVKAKIFLIDFSGLDFKDPEKYLQWYRDKYYK